MGGANFCDPKQDQLVRSASEQAINAVKNNPRFRCVDLSRVEPQTEEAQVVDKREGAFQILAETDAAFRQLNEERIHRDLFANPNWNRMKYAVIGRLQCESHALRLSDYIPEEQIAAMRPNLELSTQMLQTNPLQNDAAQALAVELPYERKRREYLDELLENPEQLAADGYLPGDGAFACGPLEDGGLIESFVDGSHPNSQTDPLLNRIAFDSTIRGCPGVHFGIDPLLRFFVEGHGGTTEHWHKTHVGGRVATDFQFRNIAPILRQEQASGADPLLVGLLESLPRSNQRLCEYVKETSLNVHSSEQPERVLAADQPGEVINAEVLDEAGDQESR